MDSGEGRKTAHADEIKNKIPALVILVVDDDEFLIREITSLILFDKNLNLDPEVRAKISILSARNGAEALSILQNNTRINLILLDIIMPIMDGYEICKILRRNPEFAHCVDIPIFFISGAIKDTQEQLRGLELEADEVFSKPFDPLLLGSYIKKELKRQIAAYQLELARQSRNLITQIQERAQKQNIFHFVSSHTYSHSARVEVLSTLIGQSPVLELREHELFFLKEMVREHDKGKIGIPEEILNKPRLLSEHELSIIQMHTAISSFLINAETAEAFSPAVYGELFHHEKYLGGGYPSGRPLLREDPLGVNAGERALSLRLHLLLSIVSCADALDALTSKRPYKDAASLLAASQILVEYSFVHFDPLVVEALFERLVTIDEAALKRIDQSVTPTTIEIYRCFGSALRGLRTSGFTRKVIEYYEQDVPDCSYARETSEIRAFFFEKIFKPCIDTTVEEKLTNGWITDPGKCLGEVFKKQAPSLRRLTEFNPFLYAAAFLEIGCSYRFLSFKDIEAIKEEILIRVPGIERISSRLERLKEIYNACLVLFLLQTLYYIEYLDLNNIERAEYLLGEYNLFFELGKKLRKDVLSLSKADYTLMRKVMGEFYEKVLVACARGNAPKEVSAVHITHTVDEMNASWLKSHGQQQN
jgi:putative two-component system response regulator